MVDFSLYSKSELLKQRYHLHNLIAQSTHSRVFLASDLALERKCVVKQLYSDHCPAKVKQAMELMFHQEAKILTKLAGRHPQICQFYDYFRDSGSLYIVQEWIQGITLEQKLHRQRKLSESETKDILLKILTVLECIHSQGIIHRDIKPNNIILRSKDNLPVLIDFGVAQEVSTRQQKVIVGTPGYMSLEQAMGKATYNNDLYSLGLTAIHLLTGRLPQTVDLEQQHDFSYNLTVVINRAIASDSTLRFASAREMRLALQSSRESFLTQTNTIEFPLSTWRIFSIIGIQLVAMGFGWHYLDFKLDQQPAKVFFDSPSTELLSLPTQDELKPSLASQIQDVIFVPGTSENEVLQTLGEPVWRKPGFWANSVAWSYEDVVAEGIDLGYMFDDRTNKLRQAEIAVPPLTDLETVQSALNSLLAAEQPSLDLKQGLHTVYQRQKASHNFTIGNLEGIIQRNDKDRIYIAVWEADFH
ncbi:serine/threonine protein kinase [Pleurocapsales cyanobacterium LEGE 10410]|nr:serine/threonine protein kinase [Pleurocapsales cyanobacterium LEGE 10410]